MTLIVGIKCEGGIVMAADGAATFGSASGEQTIRQDVKKLKLICGKIIFGSSGPVGMGQRYANVIQDTYEANTISGKKPIDAMMIISDKLRPHLSSELELAKSAAPLLGGRVNGSWMCSAIIALPIKRELCLFEFPPIGSPEEKTADMPFVTIGSGQQTADPFLAFLKRIIWKEKVPTMGIGILSAVWTIRHAIQTSPGGVADPIQVAILTQDCNEFKCKELTDSELEEHREFVNLAESYIQSAVLKLDGQPPENFPKLET